MTLPVYILIDIGGDWVKRNQILVFSPKPEYGAENRNSEHIKLKFWNLFLLQLTVGILF